MFQQKLVAQYILEALLEARPRALLTVQREPPETKRERQARVAAIRAATATEDAPPPEDAEPFEPPQIAEGSDLFLIDSGMTARVPGYVDALAFRLVFTGQTAALRTFLNRLGTFELPIIVREVAVEPATSEESAAIAPIEEGVSLTGEPADVAPSVVLSAEPAAPAGASKSAKKAPSVSTTRKAAPRATPIVARPWSKFTVTVEYIDLVPTSTRSEDAPAEAAPSEGAPSGS